MSETRPLTPKEEEFCQSYIELGFYAAAYRAAYSTARMSEDTVRRRALEVAARPVVAARIVDLQAEVAARHQVSQDDVIREYTYVGFSDISEVVSVKDGVLTIRDLDRLPERVRRTISVIRAKVVAVEERTIDGEKVKYEVLQLEVKLHDKMNALNALGRNLGLFKGDVSEGLDTLTQFLRELDGSSRGLPGGKD